MEEMKNEPIDPDVAALVAALRIFAARGRKIREERAQNKNLSSAESNEMKAGNIDAERSGEREAMTRSNEKTMP